MDKINSETQETYQTLNQIQGTKAPGIASYIGRTKDEGEKERE